jgi:hypothetical protein
MFVGFTSQNGGLTCAFSQAFSNAPKTISCGSLSLWSLPWASALLTETPNTTAMVDKKILLFS